MLGRGERKDTMAVGRLRQHAIKIRVQSAIIAIPSAPRDSPSSASAFLLQTPHYNQFK
jgi:hypothetical protein